MSSPQCRRNSFLTQPAVTLQIKTLEDELGIRLFERSGGKIRLTEAGQVSLDYAVRIADLYREAETAVGVLIGEERGRLAIGASTTIAQYVLPRLIIEFLSRHPNIEFSVISGNTENIVRAPDNKAIALGLVEGPVGLILKQTFLLKTKLSLSSGGKYAALMQSAAKAAL